MNAEVCLAHSPITPKSVYHAHNHTLRSRVGGAVGGAFQSRFGSLNISILPLVSLAELRVSESRGTRLWRSSLF